MTYFKTFFSTFAVAFLLYAKVLPLHAQVPDPDGSLAERLSHHVHLLAADSLEGRSLGSRGKYIAIDYIAKQFEAAKLQPFQNGTYLQPFQLRHANVNLEATNVIGMIEGSDSLLRHEYIVLGAHYDHIGFEPQKEGEERVFNGADDNASGVAMLLELARHYGQHPEKTSRSLIFIAFDAEEIGLRGARHFVENSGLDDILAIRLMFSLDMVGMYESNNGLDIKGIGAVLGGTELAQNLSEKHGIRLKNTSAEIEARTDTWPFGEAGIPAVHVFTGFRSSPYHQPQDAADLLEYEGMARITTYMKELVSELSAQQVVEPSPRFVRATTPGAVRVKFGVLATTGASRHRYPDAYYTSGNPLFSTGAGVFAQLHLGRSIIQPELLYDYNGSDTEEGKFRRHSITFPLNLQLPVAYEAGGLFRLFSVTGVYGRYSFAGTAGEQDLDLGGLHRDLEWGLNLGMGFQIFNFNVAYNWRRALNTVTTDELNSYASSGMLTVGYCF